MQLRSDHQRSENSNGCILNMDHQNMHHPGLKLYQGWVQHTRNAPARHKFRYKYFQVWLDVEQPELIDRISPFWSSSGFNLVQFKRQNYQPSNESIHASVTHFIKQKTNREFQGKIYLLGNLTYWGYCYNPVSFFFCYDQAQELQYILSEIHNTPWGERFTYLHDLSNCSNSVKKPSSSRTNDRHDGTFRFKFAKDFHVSPFMPMDLKYDWHFKISDEKIVVSMNLQQDLGTSVDINNFDQSDETTVFNATLFNATMNLSAAPMTKNLATKVAFQYPLICFKVLFAIYWQALLLWCKRVPFFTHPNEIQR